MNLKIINVSNGSKKYPGSFTIEEHKIIVYNCSGSILHLFSGRSGIGDVRVDYSCKEATINEDVFKFLEINNKKFDTIIIDAPYNEKFANEYQTIGNTSKQFIIFADTKRTTNLFNLITTKIQPEIIIIKSWNYYVQKGYSLKEGFLCYAGGFRKPTILLILKKLH